MNAVYVALAAIPLPLPVFGLIVTFVYGLLKFFIPSLPFNEEQISFVLTSLLALLGIVVTATMKVRGVL